MNWLVEFAGCPEAVIRTGTLAEVSVPDDLGCPVVRVRQAERVTVRAAWVKDGELRVDV